MNNPEVSLGNYLKKIKQNKQVTAVFIAVAVFFAIFIVWPAVTMFLKAFLTKDNSFTFGNFSKVLSDGNFWMKFSHSVQVSLISAVITTILAFILAYTESFSTLPGWIKRIIRTAAVFPMLLPTITYGFAIIYSFGKEGLITKLLGFQLFDFYGVKGMVFAYVVYTLPISFTLLRNTMSYIDKRYLIVCRVMGDNSLKTFRTAILIPMLGTIAVSLVQSFFLSFTDFGIPASIGKDYPVIAMELYNSFFATVPPDYNSGAVLAITMLIPSIISICLLNYLQRFNIRYNKISKIETKKNTVSDIILAVISFVILFCVVSIFAVIFVVPFVKQWPYNLSFSTEAFASVFTDRSHSGVFLNSLLISLMTAIFGSILVYAAALVSSRSKIHPHGAKLIDAVAQITNTIPGMVLGIAFLLTFKKTGLHNTIWIVLFCNMIHFFATPYLMMKSTLDKMNASWETTALILGDNWIKTVIRIVTPNALKTIFEVFIYLFINGMVTVSAVVFIVSAKTDVITTLINSWSDKGKSSEIFVLSLLILVINLIMKSLKGIINKKMKTDLD